MLEKWAGQLLHLVDPWLSQTADYLDVANVNQTEQDRCSVCLTEAPIVRSCAAYTNSNMMLTTYKPSRGITPCEPAMFIYGTQHDVSCTAHMMCMYAVTARRYEHCRDKMRRFGDRTQV